MDSIHFSTGTNMLPSARALRFGHVKLFIEPEKREDASSELSRSAKTNNRQNSIKSFRFEITNIQNNRRPPLEILFRDSEKSSEKPQKLKFPFSLISRFLRFWKERSLQKLYRKIPLLTATEAQKLLKQETFLDRKTIEHKTATESPSGSAIPGSPLLEALKRIIRKTDDKLLAREYKTAIIDILEQQQTTKDIAKSLSFNDDSISFRFATAEKPEKDLSLDKESSPDVRSVEQGEMNKESTVNPDETLEVNTDPVASDIQTIAMPAHI